MRGYKTTPGQHQGSAHGRSWPLQGSAVRCWRCQLRWSSGSATPHPAPTAHPSEYSRTQAAIPQQSYGLKLLPCKGRGLPVASTVPAKEALHRCCGMSGNMGTCRCCKLQGCMLCAGWGCLTFGRMAMTMMCVEGILAWRCVTVLSIPAATLLPNASVHSPTISAATILSVSSGSSVDNTCTAHQVLQHRSV